MTRIGSRMVAAALLLVAGLAALSPADSARGAPPQVLEHVQSKFRVPVGAAQFKLICPVISPDKSSLMVEWTKNGETIDPDGTTRIKFSKNQRELRLKNVILEDSGAYECQAANGFGHRKILLTLHVYNPDSDSSFLKDSLVETQQPKQPEWQPGAGVEHASANPIHLRAGDRMELRCPARGSPLPEIRWYKDNILLQNGPDPYSASYVIESVNENTTASYRCVVENNLGSIDAVFRVHVQKEESEATPTIERSFNSSVKSGRTAQLQCRVKASSPPIIKWFKQVEDPAMVRKADPNATVINNLFGMMLLLLDQPHDVVSVEAPIHRAGGEHTYTNRLVIPAVRQEHAGKYVCVVTSSTPHQFRMVHKTAQLDVIEDLSSMGLSSEVIWLIIIPVTALFLILALVAIIWLRCTQEDCVSKSQLKGRPPPPQRPPPAAPHQDPIFYDQKPLTAHNLESFFPSQTLQTPSSATLQRRPFLHRGAREDFSTTLGRAPLPPTSPYWGHQGRTLENQLYGQHYRTLEPEFYRKPLENPYDSGSGIDQSQPFLSYARESFMDSSRSRIPYP
ncbi:unnamed protein product, partial [Mesorhabditis belari]|uniref:Ig-like domain-containing protein n=1 Tax=Mesorhabditis belari TaxID=2138241 RepID=A0AAF3FHY1_9BILA